MNNPVAYWDPNGEEVWKHTEGDKTTYVFNIAVNNSGGFSDEDINTWSNSSAKQIESSFSGKSENSGMEYKAIVNMDYKNNEANSGTYSMDFKRNVEVTPLDGAIGYTESFGNTSSNNIEIEAPGMENNGHKKQTEEGVSRTAAHEVGHTGDLRHPNLKDNKLDGINLPSNLMFQNSHPWSMNGRELEGVQLDEFSKNVQEVNFDSSNPSREEIRVMSILEEEEE